VPLKLYFAFTILAGVCDTVDFIAQIIRFGRPGDEYSDILLVAACTVFVFADWVYICWAYHYVMQLPDEIRGPIMTGFLGSTEKLKEVAGKGVNTVKTGFKKGFGMHKAKAGENN